MVNTVTWKYVIIMPRYKYLDYLTVDIKIVDFYCFNFYLEEFLFQKKFFLPASLVKKLIYCVTQ